MKTYKRTPLTRAVDRRAQPSAAASYERHVNPHLAEMLRDLGLDATYTRGRGATLIDAEGREVLDGIAQYGALPFGYNPTRIWDALQSVRARQEPSFAQPSILPAAAELARRLLVHAPWLARCTFANSGAEAVEVAIKLSRAATRRDGVLSACGGFHGKTLAALSATARASYRAPFGAPLPGFANVPFGDLDALAEELATERYAAFLVEPIQGEGGIVVAPAGYLRAAAELCRAHGTLLVVDEVQTGLGRTGAMLASVAQGVEADVVVLAKALGGGLMPIGAVLCRAEGFGRDFALAHSSTFAGNALACRAGIATLDWLEERDGALLADVRRNGAWLRRGLCALQARYPRLIEEVRGEGFMLGLKLGVDHRTWSESLVGCASEQGVLGLLICGMLLRYERVRLAPALHGSDVLRVEPPLTMTIDECGRLLSALERVLARIAGGDSVAMLAHLVGEPPRVTGGSRPDIERPARRPSARGTRFAFLVHPLSADTLVHLDPRLASLSPAQRADLQGRLQRQCGPFVIGDVQLTATSGALAHGTFIALPHTAEQLVSMPRVRALDAVRDAVALARTHDPAVIGLGGFTSVVTNGGRALGPGLPPMTTGSTYTALSGDAVVTGAMAERGLRPTETTIALVGASGAIGQRLQERLASRARRLILIGNPGRRHGVHLLRRTMISTVARARAGRAAAPGTVLARIEALLPARSDREVVDALEREGTLVFTVETSAARRADVVMCATSSCQRFLTPEIIGAPAVLCDLSRPLNVDPARFATTLVIEGGVVRFPGSPTLPMGRELPPGRGYACMAEAAVLALSGETELADVGRLLSRADGDALGRLATELGFVPDNPLVRKDPSDA